MKQINISKAQYYYLVSGLPELNSPDLKAERLMDMIQEWITENLSAEDRRQFNYLIYRNDNKNLLYILRKQKGYPETSRLSFHKPAVFTHQELEEGLIGLKKLPDYMQTFLEVMRTQKIEWGRKTENLLKSLYYDEALELSDPYLRNYFYFKRDLKNIICALNARKYGYPLNESLIGDYELIHELLKNTSSDFGLSRTHPYINDLIDLIDRRQFKILEERIDKILCEYLDEHVQGRFDISSVHAYFIKLSLGNRWLALDEDSGMNALNNIMDHVLQSGVWPEDFIHVHR